MTSGERMVWAAEFVRALAADAPRDQAAFQASGAVWELEELGRTLLGRKPRPVDMAPADHRAMVADMLGTGADR